MPHRRPRDQGSFGSHFDELVVQFPDEPASDQRTQLRRRSQRLQEKIDIHAALFRRAWDVDDGSPSI